MVSERICTSISDWFVLYIKSCVLAGEAIESHSYERKFICAL